MSRRFFFGLLGGSVVGASGLSLSRWRSSIETPNPSAPPNGILQFKKSGGLLVIVDPSLWVMVAPSISIDLAPETIRASLLEFTPPNRSPAP